MKFHRLAIPDVLLIEPKKFQDERGYFSEVFREDQLTEIGFTGRFVQDNHSFSAQKGTLRGLHYQRAPHAQDKLVRVIRGSILTVAVDIRDGSPTYGQNVSTELSAQNELQILVPKGFAYGFVTLEPNTEVLYKVSDYYAPGFEAGIRWDDPQLAIDWKLDGGPLLSARDQGLPLFQGRAERVRQRP